MKMLDKLLLMSGWLIDKLTWPIRMIDETPPKYCRLHGRYFEMDECLGCLNDVKKSIVKKCPDCGKEDCLGDCEFI